MVSKELTLRMARTWRSLSRPSMCNQCFQSRRTMATEAVVAAPEDPATDLIDSTSLSPGLLPDSETAAFDPLKVSRARKRQLPPSRYELQARNVFARWTALTFLVHEDTNTDLPNTTAALCILTVLRQTPIHPPVFLFPALFPHRVLKPRITPS